MKTALLVIDIQQALVDYLPVERAKAFLDIVAPLIARARATHVPVIYVQHQDDELVAGTPGWEVARDIAPHAHDRRIYKTFRDAFRETNLDDVLRELGVEHLVVCGMQTEYCVDSTLREAERRGYEVTLASDAHATYASEELSETQIRNHVNGLARGVAKTITPASSLFV